MKRMYQTKFGNGNGNCLLACVASVLERDIDSIPDFNMSGAGWFEELYEWCVKERIGLIKLNPEGWKNAALLNSWAICCFSVQGSDEHHAAVGKCVRGPNQEHEDGLKWTWECCEVFDPNPRGVKALELLYMLFLIPDPPLADPERK